MKRDAPAIAQRVAFQLSRDAEFEPLVSDEFSRHEFESALAATPRALWVDDAHGRIRGHLYGATFDDPLFGRQTWSGPDGYSFESDNVLDNLCARAYPEWRQDGSTAHLVWALAGQGTRVWTDRGYRIVSVRGARELHEAYDVQWPEGFSLRRGEASDLASALDFDALIDTAQGVDLALLTSEQRRTNEADLVELLEDPDCYYYLVENDSSPVAQCVTFTLPPLRGNFDDTIYISALAVRPDHQRRGIATRLLRTIFNTARTNGARYAEVRWHIDNEPATSLWSRVGFRPTYVQLRRSLLDLAQR
jgi:GNAT superfamily N-acetyltransferase